jgi:hypothetical protein
MFRYFDPRAYISLDYVFEKHNHLCISLLNALLPLKPDQQIVSVEHLPDCAHPFDELGRRTVADVRCTDIQGRLFTVVVQMEWTDAPSLGIAFDKSCSRAYVRQLRKAPEYSQPKPIYLLSLVNETLWPDSPDF